MHHAEATNSMASGQGKSLATIVRHYRLEHGWTQEQLALAAGLNLRTVQRVESGAACSGDTLRALAAALRIEAGELAAAAPVNRSQRTWLSLGRSVAAICGAILCLPGIVFVALNTAYYEVGLGMLEPIMTSWLWITVPEHYLAPLMLVGGPAICLLLNVPHMLSLRLRRRPEVAIVDGVIVHPDAAPWLAAIVAVAVIAALAAYVAAEFLGHIGAAVSAG
jgi:DNA-binding XRE family transcriptional regulator